MDISGLAERYLERKIQIAKHQPDKLKMEIIMTSKNTFLGVRPVFLFHCLVMMLGNDSSPCELLTSLFMTRLSVGLRSLLLDGFPSQVKLVAPEVKWTNERR